MKVSCVTGLSVGGWSNALNMLERAYQPGMADETFPMLCEDIVQCRALLWVAHIGLDVYGAACTQVVVYPNGRKVCVIRACAGHHWKEWSHTIKEIEDYAKQMGCAAVRLSGRKGWRKVLKGYHEPWVLMEKEL